MKTEVTTPSETIKKIRENGHVLAVSTRGEVINVEWGDTPCCGPICIQCGESWCLWESHIDLEVCGPLRALINKSHSPLSKGEMEEAVRILGEINDSKRTY